MAEQILFLLSQGKLRRRLTNKAALVLLEVVLLLHGLALVKSKIRLKLRRWFEVKCLVWVSIKDWLWYWILFSKKRCPLNWGRRGWEPVSLSSVSNLVSSRDCLQKKCFSSFSMKLDVFSGWRRKIVENRQMMKFWWCNAFRWIVPVPSFFFWGHYQRKKFTSSWLRRGLRILLSNFCIVFFILSFSLL